MNSRAGLFTRLYFEFTKKLFLVYAYHALLFASFPGTEQSVKWLSFFFSKRLEELPARTAHHRHFLFRCFSSVCSFSRKK
jgi:hypothetical protein